MQSLDQRARAVVYNDFSHQKMTAHHFQLCLPHLVIQTSRQLRRKQQQPFISKVLVLTKHQLRGAASPYLLTAT